MTSWQDLETELRSGVRRAGFEVFGSTTVGDYNQSLEPMHAAYRLPDHGDPRSVIVVIGNTRRLWPLFLSEYRTTGLGEEAHPLDAYSRRHLSAVAQRVAEQFRVAHTLRFSFDPPPRAVAIQRLAKLCGAADAAPVGLSVHPSHGPWFSLRAAAIFDVPGPSVASAPQAICSSCTTKPCLEARAKIAPASGGVYTAEMFLANWELWLAMRDACPIGKDARYSDQQIRYHYQKRLSILTEAVS